jgi:hypothetical protein
MQVGRHFRVNVEPEIQYFLKHTTLWFTIHHIPPAAATSVTASATVGAAAAATISVAAVSAAATIAVSAAIAAAFWLIVVCPLCYLCFRLPPPFLPASADTMIKSDGKRGFYFRQYFSILD